MAGRDPGISTAEVVVECDDLPAALEFFTGDLGFELELISPAERPVTAVVAGFGARLRLQGGPGSGADASPSRPASRVATRLRLACERPGELAAGGLLAGPAGIEVELVPVDASPDLPPAAPTFELTRAGEGRVEPGRAGMRYRDLLPDRQGGRFVASHILIPSGGPVPDYVHHHRVRFQVIYCYRGWVRVVYEGQGPPFVLNAGDCVLQPPGIRHRVLESSAGLQVIEVGCPAAHDTLTDRALALPTAELEPDRLFDGQRFSRHVAARATWEIEPSGTLEVRDTGVGRATGGLAGVRVLRPAAAGPAVLEPPPGFELELLFVLEGRAAVRFPGRRLAVPLGTGDALALPPEPGCAVVDWSAGSEILEVRLPAAAGT
jgi:uncharacterized protein YjlB